MYGNIVNKREVVSVSISALNSILIYYYAELTSPVSYNELVQAPEVKQYNLVMVKFFIAIL